MSALCASSMGAALPVTVTSLRAAVFGWALAGAKSKNASAVALATGVNLKWSAIECPVSTAGGVQQCQISPEGPWHMYHASLRKYYLDQVPGCYLSRLSRDSQHP